MAASHRCAIFALLAAFALVLGCKPKEEPGPSPGPSPKRGPVAAGPEPTGPYAAGIKVFRSHCSNCHAIGDAPSGGRGKKRGPNLAKVASDPNHTEEWLRDFILDPKSQKPDSKGMPAFQGKIDDEEFKALIAYLSSLK